MARSVRCSIASTTTSCSRMWCFVLESAEFSVVSNLLLARVAGGTRRQQPFYHPLGDFLADSSNFGTIPKFALTPEATQNIGISAWGSAEKEALSRRRLRGVRNAPLFSVLESGKSWRGPQIRVTLTLFRRR